MHFQRKHKRCAAYRRYAIGSLCHACGLELFTQRRLLLHLRGSHHCCDVLAAMGKVSEQPQEGIKLWKLKPSEPFVLCPPQYKQAASALKPCHDRKWRDNPQMDEAFWNVLDWLIYFDGNMCELQEGVIGRLAVFPFYQDEFRLILQRLQESARHLIEDEGLLLWQTFRPQAMYAALGRISAELSAEVFLGEAPPCTSHTLLTEDQMQDDETWRALSTPKQLAEGSLLLILDETQGAHAQVCDQACTYQQALQAWHEDMWCKHARVQIRVPKYGKRGCT